MKKISFLLTVIIISVFGGIHAFAYSTPEKVRVGLEEKNLESDKINVGNKSILIGYETNGVFQSGGSLNANSSFSIVPSDSYFVRIEKAFGDYNSAKAFRDSLGANAAVAFVGANSFYVYLGGYGSESEAGNAPSNGQATTMVNPSNKRMALLDGTAAVVIFDNPSVNPQIADSNNSFVSLGDRKYRGVIEVGRYKGKKVTAVNVVPLEEYLYSAVPSEMSSQWHMEALKSQAVAARNYAVTRIGIHSADGYDLCDLIHSQVYLGAGNEAASTTQAVNETKGLMILYNDQPINSSFFSSSGGATDDSENVWTNADPYLRSKKEVAEKEYKEWTRSFTLDEITSLLAKQDISIGNATGVTIGKASNGRVNELTIKGTNGTKSFTKEAIRTFFTGSTGGLLESRNFDLKDGTVVTTSAAIGNANANAKAFVLNGNNNFEVDLKGQYAVSANSGVVAITTAVVAGKDTVQNYSGGSTGASVSTSTGNVIVFSGKGWGHGVGMSQFGAKGMAESGYSFKQILEFYYTGVQVK